MKVIRLRLVMVLCAAVTSFFISSCSSENRQDDMYDTSENADTAFMGADTTNVADTSNMDTLGMQHTTPVQ